MRVDQPLYAMDLPGGFHLEELEGADRWSSGAQEVVVSVLRVPASDLVSASYTGKSEDGEVYVAVLMTARAIEGLAYVASVYVFAPSARALGPSILSSLELG